MSREVDVIVFRVGQPAVVETVKAETADDELEACRAICGGNIESWGIAPDLHVLCHGTGMIDGLAPNRAHARLGIIHGDFLVSRCGLEGEMANVTPADLALATRDLQPVDPRHGSKRGGR